MNHLKALINKGTTEFFYSPKNDQKNVMPHKEYNYSKSDEFGVVKENQYVFKMMFLLGNLEIQLKKEM